MAQSSQYVRDKVVTFCCNTLSVDVEPEDISTALRFTPRTGENPGQAGQVIVHFTSRVVRDEVYYAKGKLRAINTYQPADQKFYVNEDFIDLN